MKRTPPWPPAEAWSWQTGKKYPPFQLLHGTGDPLVPCAQMDTLYEKLKARGVLVRHFTKARIADYNRITIGTREQMDILFAAISDILEETP